MVREFVRRAVLGFAVGVGVSVLALLWGFTIGGFGFAIAVYRHVSFPHVLLVLVALGLCVGAGHVVALLWQRKS